MTWAARALGPLQSCRVNAHLPPCCPPPTCREPVTGRVPPNVMPLRLAQRADEAARAQDTDPQTPARPTRDVDVLLSGVVTACAVVTRERRCGSSTPMPRSSARERPGRVGRGGARVVRRPVLRAAAPVPTVVASPPVGGLRRRRLVATDAEVPVTTDEGLTREWFFPAGRGATTLGRGSLAVRGVQRLRAGPRRGLSRALHTRPSMPVVRAGPGGHVRDDDAPGADPRGIVTSAPATRRRRLRGSTRRRTR